VSDIVFFFTPSLRVLKSICVVDTWFRKVRGIFLTKIFNIIASYGWMLTTSNGSGGGKQRNFAEMYVFCRSKVLRRKRTRQSTAVNYSHLFPNFAADEDPHLDDELDSMTMHDSMHANRGDRPHGSSGGPFHHHHEDSFREPVAILLPSPPQPNDIPHEVVL
jgi:hypothetical protein